MYRTTGTTATTNRAGNDRTSTTRTSPNRAGSKRARKRPTRGTTTRPQDWNAIATFVVYLEQRPTGTGRSRATQASRLVAHHMETGERLVRPGMDGKSLEQWMKRSMSAGIGPESRGCPVARI